MLRTIADLDSSGWYRKLKICNLLTDDHHHAMQQQQQRITDLTEYFTRTKIDKVDGQ